VTIKSPSETLNAAIREARSIAHDPDIKRFSNVEEALRELKDEP